jgi:hypothetical protein
MLLNDTKGSLGMFSSAGKNSAEKYHILSKKDEIINGKIKKKVFSSNLNPEDVNLSDYSDDEDERQLLNDTKNFFNNRKIVKIELRKVKTIDEVIIDHYLRKDEYRRESVII